MNYYYTLDIMRGIAAVAILFWHYQHFYVTDRALQPLYDYFYYFYEYGDYAVQFFWVLSGFVFTNVYFAKKGTTWDFVTNRFARLYPLHLLTLLVVAALQLLHLKTFGQYQIYQYNDWYHFILNLFFVPWGYGLEEGRSFNAPVWSVTVEVFIYICFWFLLGAIIKYKVLASSLVSLLFISFLWLSIPGSIFWQCGTFFFVGSVLFFITQSNNLVKVLTIISLISANILFLFFFEQHLLKLMALFSGAVLIGAIFDQKYVKKSKTPWLGNISYGVYLLHIPVQLALMYFLELFTISKSVVETVLFLSLFLLSVIILASFTYYFYEKPTQDLIKVYSKNSKLF